MVLLYGRIMVLYIFLLKQEEHQICDFCGWLYVILMQGFSGKHRNTKDSICNRFNFFQFYIFFNFFFNFILVQCFVTLLITIPGIQLTNAIPTSSVPGYFHCTFLQLYLPTHCSGKLSSIDQFSGFIIIGHLFVSYHYVSLYFKHKRYNSVFLLSRWLLHLAQSPLVPARQQWITWCYLLFSE